MSTIHSFTKYFLLTHHKTSQKNNWKDIRHYLFFFLKYCFKNLPEGRKIIIIVPHQHNHQAQNEEGYSDLSIPLT